MRTTNHSANRRSAESYIPGEERKQEGIKTVEDVFGLARVTSELIE